MKNLKINRNYIKKLMIYGTGMFLGSILIATPIKISALDTKGKTQNRMTESEDKSKWHIETAKKSIEPIGLDSDQPQIEIEVKELEQLKTEEEEVKELLEKSPEYQKIAEYVSEIQEEDLENFVNEVLDYYGITSKMNTFRFDPNNLSEMDARIKTYAEKMDSEENMTYRTECYINVTEEDRLVNTYMEEYQATHKEISEEELKEIEKEFKEKAAAVYYTKMNLKYLSEETLRNINKKYHFVEESENLIEDIKNYANNAFINYEKTPLMREMVANQGDYTAQDLLDLNTNTKRLCALLGENKPVVVEVIRGDFGDGEERKENLGKAGYNYFVIQEALNVKLGVVSNKKTALYKIENGRVVYNLPGLPTDKEELCKFALTERKFQEQYIKNTLIHGNECIYHFPESYNPEMVLVEQVVEGHAATIHYMLYGMEESIEKDILNQLDYCSPLDLFETIERVQEVTEASQKSYK